MTKTAVHIESTGQGRDLVLLHGWAMHSGYFEPVVEKLASHFRVHLVDMPGHGKSQAYPQIYSIENIARRVLEALAQGVSDKAICLGWSLGGSVATWLAAHAGHKVSALILVASNPCFVQKAGWPHGMENSVLQTFADELVSDYEKTLLRFLSLQIRGTDNERDLLRLLRRQMRATPAPEIEVLNGGLEILQHYDGRDLVTQLRQAVFMIGGEKDTLVPVRALRTLAAQSGNIKLSEWVGTGHTPFLTDPNRFCNEVKAFADGLVV